MAASSSFRLGDKQVREVEGGGELRRRWKRRSRQIRITWSWTRRGGCWRRWRSRRSPRRGSDGYPFGSDGLQRGLLEARAGPGGKAGGAQERTLEAGREPRRGRTKRAGGDDRQPGSGQKQADERRVGARIRAAEAGPVGQRRGVGNCRVGRRERVVLGLVHRPPIGWTELRWPRLWTSPLFSAVS